MTSEPSIMYHAVQLMVQHLGRVLPIVTAHSVRRATKGGLGVPRPALVFDTALRQLSPTEPACPALMAFMREACDGRPDLWVSFLLCAARHGHVPVCEAIAVERPALRDADICGEAAKHGHRRLIKWALSRGFALGGACYRAAQAGDLALVQWLHERVGETPEGDFSLGAAAAGCLPVLQWSHDSGCPTNLGIMEEAAARGHVSVMQWVADNRGYILTTSVLVFAIDKAAETGHLAVLEWAVSTGRWELGRGHDVWRVFFAAVEGGQVQVLQWMFDRHWPLSSHAFGVAIRLGHLNVVQWLLDRGCRPLGVVNDTMLATYHNNLEMLSLLLDNGFPACAERCSVAAATTGSIAALEFLADRRMLVTSEEVLDAARNGGHEAALQWLMGAV